LSASGWHALDAASALGLLEADHRKLKWLLDERLHARHRARRADLIERGVRTALRL